MTGLVRRCPKCNGLRPLNEIVCQAVIESGGSCSFPLINVRPTPASATGPHGGESAAIKPDQTHSRSLRCPNGHNAEEGDVICVACGAAIGTPSPELEPTSPAASTRIDNWTILETLVHEPGEAMLFRVRSEEDAAPRLLRLFTHGVEPETRIYPAIQRLNTSRVAKLIATGRTEERAYEVWDEIDGQTLVEVSTQRVMSEHQIRDVVLQVADALTTLQNYNLRHGNLDPSAIRFRSSDPIDLQIGELSTATLAEFNLEIARIRPLTRYLSPETIVGTSSRTSDWWSLGIIILELLTNGRCFEHVNDRAFLLHVVARNLELPADLGGDWMILLRGLLTRDHDKRWRGAEVKRWLAGDRDIPVFFEATIGERLGGTALSLGGKPYRDARSFALAAAQTENWDEALALTEMGTVATWLAGIDPGNSHLRQFKQLMEERRLSRDHRFALALLTLNEHLPLALRGNIQTPNRFLEQPTEAGAWFEKPAINALVALKREAWIVRLAERADRIRARAEELGLNLVEDRFQVARLAAFESRLEDFWHQRRQIFPDTAVPGLAALLERRNLTDEDLILLICADDLAFRSSEQVIEEAKKLALETGVVEFDASIARRALEMSKRVLIEQIEERIGAFKRTTRQPIDDWADAVRLGRRLPLAQLLVLRAVPKNQWQEPPHQDFLRNVLEYLQKKILANLQRGPLVKLTIGRSTSRIDVTDVGDQATSQTLIERAISRSDQPLLIGAASIPDLGQRNDRLKRIAKAADLYKRETGVSALVLAFPLITLKDQSLSGASSVRIAPLGLWPLKLSIKGGQISVSYDKERDPEINPALEKLLGSDSAKTWQGKFESMLRDGVERIPELFAAFRELTDDADPSVCPIPDQTQIQNQIRPKLVSAGALMLADFPSRAIVEDLRTILGKPLSGTVLEYLLRLKEAENTPIPARPKEVERFTTLDADPSQEEAVLAVRQIPGLKLEGPPGTGKSQTIVNIIADCLGRNETVMLVCEKQVALEVVYKRLCAEGLERRIVRIESTQSDRARLLGELQTQIPQIKQTPLGAHNEIRTQRLVTATAIDHLETDLTKYHEAVYAASSRLGLSYRDVVSRIGALHQVVTVSAPALRPILGALTPSDVERTIGECLALIEPWYEADFTNDNLELFRVFTSDSALEERLLAAFQVLNTAEDARQSSSMIAAPMTGFSLETDPADIELWRVDHEEELKSLSVTTKQILLAWREVLDSNDEEKSIAEAILVRLEMLTDRLPELIPTATEIAVYEPLVSASDVVVQDLSTSAPLFSANTSFFSKFNLRKMLSRRRVRIVLKALSLPFDRANAEVACIAAGKERALRAARSEYGRLRQRLQLQTATSSPNATDLRADAEKLIEALSYAIGEASRIRACAWSDLLWDGLAASEEAWAQAFVRIAAAGDLLSARVKSHAVLESLAPWTEGSWLTARQKELRQNKSLKVNFSELVKAIRRLTPYQLVRQSQMSPSVSAVFSALLPLRGALDRLTHEERRIAVAAMIKREAAFAWAEEIRKENPVLASSPAAMQEQVDSLRGNDEKIRSLNRRLLSVVDPQKLAPVHQWSQIWQIGGINAKRLRQVFELGNELGLLAARPIWLINPDVASRVFPLKPGLFDVVIFDEASQMRVENAVAALYRAKRAVVSGDSKQLPPANFFGSTVEDDDDDSQLEEMIGEDADSETTETQRRDKIANRRHVKDCQDLLALSQGILPERSLTIHYRSAYRELIDFSNAAYYGGSLNIPISRPPDEVRRHKPIEMRRIDGTYARQCNEKEADAVVDYLAELWSQHGASPPTTGVVTFNLKQAETIDDALQRRANSDRAFKAAFDREQSRAHNGEDVGFFVRNLENVQGDERDIIIFSTTFGRDSQDRFKRSFGVLTQQGGERRLNVAITRAKLKIVLVTSLPTATISDFLGRRRGPTKARDYLQAYVRYAEQIDEGELDAATAQLSVFKAFEESSYQHRDGEADGLTKSVQSILEEAGYSSVLMPARDAFSVDVAVLNAQTSVYSLGIEIDGPRHHILNSAKARDIWRPSLLRRSGMNVHRIYSAAWAADHARERERLLSATRKSMERA